MNILFVTKLDGRPWGGPTYSVPKQIMAQSKFDNVLWYNLVKEAIPQGKEHVDNWRKLPYYVDLCDYPHKKIELLPAPFSKPDLIVIEQGYPFAKELIRYEICCGTVPYIIIPRGELTEKAQKKKRIKKIIGNFVLGYPRFTRNARAIQCLTKEEAKETSKKWNSTQIILPNGTDKQEVVNKQFHQNEIRCVSIGRIEPYQKGLDLLVEACAEIKDELMNANCTISIYGPDRENKLSEIKRMVEERGLTQIIKFYPPVFNEEKSAVLKSSDVFLMPSRFEGHPTSLLEALAYGVPSVVTTGSNMKDEIDEYDAGWTSENTVEGLKRAIQKMIFERTRFVEKGNNAIRLSNKFNWIAIAERSHEEYQNLLGMVGNE